MFISNNKNSSIIDLDEVRVIYKVTGSYGNGTSDIQFCFKNNSGSVNWNFKTREERDQVLELIKRKLGAIEINDTDVTL